MKTTKDILFKFFTISNAIENVHDEMEATSFVEFFRRTTDMPLEESMYQLHSQMNYLNEYCKAWKLRDYQVYVGGRECLKHQLIENALRVLFARNPKTWEDIKAWHIDFEHIHPFGDGNGRVGRYLMMRQIWDANIEIPIMFREMDNFEENRQEYYKWF